MGHVHVTLSWPSRDQVLIMVVILIIVLVISELKSCEHSQKLPPLLLRFLELTFVDLILGNTK